MKAKKFITDLRTYRRELLGLKSVLVNKVSRLQMTKMNPAQKLMLKEVMSKIQEIR